MICDILSSGETMNNSKPEFSVTKLILRDNLGTLKTFAGESADPACLDRPFFSIRGYEVK
jgi:hypothetical protein